MSVPSQLNEKPPRSAATVLALAQPMTRQYLIMPWCLWILSAGIYAIAGVVSFTSLFDTTT